MFVFSLSEDQKATWHQGEYNSVGKNIGIGSGGQGSTALPLLTGGSMVKNLPAKAERLSSLGWEDPLEEEMATLSSILTWKIPLTEEPGGLQSMGSPKSRTRLSNWARMHVSNKEQSTERGSKYSKNKYGISYTKSLNVQSCSKFFNLDT